MSERSDVPSSDSSSLFSSATPARALEAIARIVEEETSKGGWDQRPKLFALVDPVTMALMAPDRLPDDPSDSVVLGVIPLEPIEGHPFDHLVGTRAPQFACGLLLVTEAWGFPADVDLDATRYISPDHHPRRQEIRVVFAVTREHQVACLHRVRDGEAKYEYTVGPIPGRIVGSMQRALGLPTAPSALTPQEFLGTLWLARAVPFAEDAIRNGNSVMWSTGARGLVRDDGHVLAPSDEITRLTGDSSTALSWEALRELAASGQINGVAPEAADWMDDNFFASCIVDALPEAVDLLETLTVLVGDVSAASMRKHLHETGWLRESYQRQPGLS